MSQYRGILCVQRSLTGTSPCRFTITVSFFPRLMLPLLHGEPVFPRGRAAATSAEQQQLIFFSVTSFCKIYGPALENIDAIDQVVYGSANPRTRDGRSRTARSFSHLLNLCRAFLVPGSSLPARRATTIRIEGTGHGSPTRPRVGRAPYSAEPRCWITQNTYQFYIGFLEANAAPEFVRIRPFFARCHDVYTARSLARKWINVINGHPRKSSPGNWFSCRVRRSYCSLLPEGQDGGMQLRGEREKNLTDQAILLVYSFFGTTRRKKLQRWSILIVSLPACSSNVAITVPTDTLVL